MFVSRRSNTCNFWKPKRHASDKYGTDDFILGHPRRLSVVKLGSFEKGIKSLASKKLQNSRFSVARLGNASWMPVKQRGERDRFFGMMQCRKVNSRRFAGNFDMANSRDQSKQTFENDKCSKSGDLLTIRLMISLKVCLFGIGLVSIVSFVQFPRISSRFVFGVR